MHDKNSDLEITAVFCGFDKNNLDYLKSISKLGIQNNVIFLNFLNEEELFIFYKNYLPSLFLRTLDQQIIYQLKVFILKNQFFILIFGVTLSK